MSRAIFVTTGFCGLAGAAGVGLAGLAAHGSDGALLEPAARFLTLHAVAALGLAALAASLPRRRGSFLASAWLFLAGGALFSADLTARAVAGSRLFPMAAPLGATLVILGWAWLVLASLVAFARKPE
jgi:uncharacterized membrane protein YgdD (TMEM256/DUF423 family)